MTSRFALQRVRPAHRDYWRSTPRDEEWLVIEWPVGELEPTKYWLATVPAFAAPDVSGISCVSQWLWLVS